MSGVNAAEILAAHSGEGSVSDALARAFANVAEQLAEKAREKATQRRKGHVEYGKHIGTAVVELNAVVDMLRKAPPTAGPIDCPAVSVDGAKCVRTNPGHEAHTFPVPGSTNTVTELKSGATLITGGVPLCDTPDWYPTSLRDGQPDRCVLPAHAEESNHKGAWSAWPVQQPPSDVQGDAIKAFLRGDIDDVPGAAEPTFGEVAADAQQIITATTSESVDPHTINTAAVAADPGTIHATWIDAGYGIGEPTVLSGNAAGTLTVQRFDPGVAALLEASVQPLWGAISALDPSPAFRPAPDPAPFLPPSWPGDSLPVSIRTTHVATGEACGLQLRLIERDGVDEQPAWWNEGGHAVHACIETIERDIINGETPRELSNETCWHMFSAALDAAIAEVESRSRHDRSLWRTANKGTENEAWWRERGPVMVRDYAAWSAQRHADGWSILALDRPALEMKVGTSFVGLTGSATLTGTLDQAWIRVAYGRAEIQIVDPKSGKEIPRSTFQLGSYARGLADLIAAAWGKVAGRDYTLSAAYYDARNGKLCEPVDPFELHSAQEIAYRAANVYNMHVVGCYPANPNAEYGGPCGICSVRHACPIMALK